MFYIKNDEGHYFAYFAGMCNVYHGFTKQQSHAVSYHTASAAAKDLHYYSLEDCEIIEEED